MLFFLKKKVEIQFALWNTTRSARSELMLEGRENKQTSYQPRRQYCYSPPCTVGNATDQPVYPLGGLLLYQYYLKRLIIGLGKARLTLLAVTHTR